MYIEEVDYISLEDLLDLFIEMKDFTEEEEKDYKAVMLYNFKS